jgi:citrate lyase subunit beta/citryl-CoA lyase
MSEHVLNPRSLLFMPGSRPQMVAKIAGIAPDVAVVDLEDAVPTTEKQAAREATVRVLRDTDFGDTIPLVRVNPTSSPWFADDLAAVSAIGHVGVVLPKYERRDEVDLLRDRLGSDAPIVVGLETARCGRLP